MQPWASNAVLGVFKPKTRGFSRGFDLLWQIKANEI